MAKPFALSPALVEKSLVGGFPFNVDQLTWDRVGADGSAANAEQPIETGSALLEQA